MANFLTQNPYATPLFLNPRPDRPAKRELTRDEVEEVHFAFNTLDSDKTGSVTARQLKVCAAWCMPGEGPGQTCMCFMRARSTCCTWHRVQGAAASGRVLGYVCMACRWRCEPWAFP